MALEVVDDRLQVIAMFFGDGLANGADFVNDRISTNASSLRQCFGRADDRRLHSRRSTGLFDPTANSRIGDVRTVPRQQIVHAAEDRDSDVECVVST